MKNRKRKYIILITIGLVILAFAILSSDQFIEWQMQSRIDYTEFMGSNWQFSETINLEIPPEELVLLNRAHPSIEFPTHNTYEGYDGCNTWKSTEPIAKKDDDGWHMQFGVTVTEMGCGWEIVDQDGNVKQVDYTSSKMHHEVGQAFGNIPTAELRDGKLYLPTAYEGEQGYFVFTRSN